MTRSFERLEELYAIGGGPGANRPHPSAEEDAAHELPHETLRPIEEQDLSETD